MRYSVGTGWQNDKVTYGLLFEVTARGLLTRESLRASIKLLVPPPPACPAIAPAGEETKIIKRKMYMQNLRGEVILPHIPKIPRIHANRLAKMPFEVVAGCAVVGGAGAFTFAVSSWTSFVSMVSVLDHFWVAASHL